jgi:hypothetical protein
MTDLLSKLKGFGGMFGKGMVIEMFLQYFEKDMIAQFKEMLDKSEITEADIEGYVTQGVALPIPREAFEQMKGIEDYLETIEETRIFEWLYAARPDLAEKLSTLGDAGVAYIFKFKRFIIDSVRAVPGKEETEPVPDKPEESPNPPEETAEDEETEQAFLTPMAVKYVGDLTEKDGDVKEAQRADTDEKKATKRVTCQECGYHIDVTEEEAARMMNEPCPECGK